MHTADLSFVIVEYEIKLNDESEAVDMIDWTRLN